MDDNPLWSPGLLPFLSHVVVMASHNPCPISNLFHVIEAVGGGDDPPVADEGAATEVAARYQLRVVGVSEGDLPWPGAGCCLETSDNSVETLSFSVK